MRELDVENLIACLRNVPHRVKDVMDILVHLGYSDVKGIVIEKTCGKGNGFAPYSLIKTKFTCLTM